MVKNFLLNCFFFAVALSLAGCGGDGSAAATQTLVPLPTSAVVRTYKQGDTLTATVKFTETSTGQVISGDVTMTIGTIVQNPFGIDCRAQIISGTLTGSGGSQVFQVNNLFYQDGSGSIYGCGEFDDTLGRYVFLTDSVTSPNGIFLENISPMQIGDSTSGVIFYDDGSWEDCTRTIVITENVSVPLGLFEAHKISETCSYSDGTNLVNSWWTRPDIPSVKEIGNIDGFTVEYALTGTNII